MPDLIDIPPQDLEKVQAILAKHVPSLDVRAFGSRVRGTARRTSDLDLVVMTDKPLDTLTMADLREAFSESDLSFKVDIVDWATTKENFRQIIEQKNEAIQYATSASPKAQSQ